MQENSGACPLGSLRGWAGRLGDTAHIQHRVLDSARGGSGGATEEQAQASGGLSFPGAFRRMNPPSSVSLIRKPLLRFSICPYFNEKEPGLHRPTRS